MPDVDFVKYLYPQRLFRSFGDSRVEKKPNLPRFLHCGGVGRGCGVGRALGVTLGAGVADGVGVGVTVAVGLGLGVGLAVGISSQVSLKDPLLS